MISLLLHGSSIKKAKSRLMQGLSVPTDWLKERVSSSRSLSSDVPWPDSLSLVVLVIWLFQKCIPLIEVYFWIHTVALLISEIRRSSRSVGFQNQEIKKLEVVKGCGKHMEAPNSSERIQLSHLRDTGRRNTHWVISNNLLQGNHREREREKEKATLSSLPRVDISIDGRDNYKVLFPSIRFYSFIHSFITVNFYTLQQT